MGASNTEDTTFMRRALELATKGLGRTRPNPAVGAVVVKDGQIVAEGWHHRAGEPHAERIALTKAGNQAKGATIYVSLEPCTHWGNTPPCTEAIIDAGISRVLFPCVDCDDRCAGQAERVLRAAGIDVDCGLMSEHARRLNEAYFKHKQTGLPFCTLKMACSLDGKTATRTGDSGWVTGEPSRERVHQLRDRSDAVMVGIGTVLADDPRLTTRTGTPDAEDAVRIIVDSHARTPTDAAVLSSQSDAECIIAVTERAPHSRIKALQRAGAQILTIDADDDGRVHLQSLMAAIGQRDLMGVLLEGGATLAAAALQADIIDKIVFFYAPKLVGGASAPTAIDGTGIELMEHARKVDIHAIERIGEDVMIEGYLCSQD